MIAPFRNTAIFSQLIGSLLIHGMVIYFFLSLPIYKAGTYGAPIEGILVYLNDGDQKDGPGLKGESSDEAGRENVISSIQGISESRENNGGMKGKQNEEERETEIAKPATEGAGKEEGKAIEINKPETPDTNIKKEESEEVNKPAPKTAQGTEPAIVVEKIVQPLHEEKSPIKDSSPSETLNKVSTPEPLVQEPSSLESGAKTGRVQVARDEPRAESGAAVAGKAGVERREKEPKVFLNTAALPDKPVKQTRKRSLPPARPITTAEASSDSGAAGKDHMDKVREDVIKKENAEPELSPRFREAERSEEGKPALGVPVAEAFLLKDIKIEISSADMDVTGIRLSLTTKPYPAKGRNGKEKQKEIDMAEETDKISISGKKGKRISSVAKAEKGIYTLVMENKGMETYSGNVTFRLFETKKEEKIKEYPEVKLAPGAVVKFKFIMPELIFWDEEARFSGSIEDSDSITKFNYDSGLVWREERE